MHKPGRVAIKAYSQKIKIGGRVDCWGLLCVHANHCLITLRYTTDCDYSQGSAGTSASRERCKEIQESRRSVSAPAQEAFT